MNKKRKAVLCIAVFAVLFAMMLPFAAVNAAGLSDDSWKSDRCFYLGDINHDGKVNVADCNLMKQLILTGVSEGSYESIVADMNEDGKINAVDMNLLKKTVAGSLPVWAIRNIYSGNGLIPFAPTVDILVCDP